MKLIQDKIEKIGAYIYSPLCPLQIEAWISKEPLPFPDRMEGQYKKLRVGDSWGDELFDCAWFRFSCPVPNEYTGERLFALLDVNGELLVVDNEGNPVEGLTNQNSTFDEDLGKPGKISYEIPGSPDLQKGDQIAIWADAGLNDLFGMIQDDGKIVHASLARRNEPLSQIYYDFLFVSSLVETIDHSSDDYTFLIRGLRAATEMLTSFSDNEIAAAAALLKPYIQNVEGKEDHTSLRLSAIGHAHLDLAWLWPLRESVRKGGRTFATALRSMERYPEYVFGASQPQLYQWVKERYPALYERVKERVDEGRWEIQGGLWAECDTNLVSSESFVRQLLHGIRFYEQEFGIRVNNVLLPDAFGFSAALPQILKLAGIDYFVTMKPAWNLTNDFPYHSFLWKGIDGSEIPSHILPEGTYNGRGTAASFVMAKDNYHEKEISNHALILYGIGDGGGGPGVDHIESLRRSEKCSGVPVVKQERIGDFYTRWIADRNKFPVWHDEIYLERHQGTFTTQGNIKKFNRMTEKRLFHAELLSVVAALMDKKNSLKVGAISAFSSEERRMIDDIWKETLLFQFHDILPGSSIKRVYDEVYPRYEKNLERLEVFTHRKMEILARALDSVGDTYRRLLFNFTPFDREEWIAVGASWKRISLPSLGFTVSNDADVASEWVQSIDMPELLTNDSDVIENEFLKLTFSDQGWISSIEDKKTTREILKSGGKGNLFSVYQDDGDCWDFSPEYREKQLASPNLESLQFVLEGPRVIARMKYSFGSSSIEQDVRLTSGSRRIDFVTRLNWADEAKMLRTSFDVDITSRMARYEIQGAYIERPTHSNTSWDRAKDEVPAQSWADLSQADRGVALLNNCKYGYRIKGQTMELNLLRSVQFPQAFINPDAHVQHSDSYTDLGEQEFCYSLLPHEGRGLEEVIIEAAFLNSPVEVHVPEAGQFSTALDQKTLHNDGLSFFGVNNRSIVIQSVKFAEDDNSVIIRLHEAFGGSVECLLTSFETPSLVESCDLTEKTLDRVHFDHRGIPLQFEPFEIISLKLHF